MLYAHTPNEAGVWHPLADHLEAVAELAAVHAAGFGGAELARWAGRWHDVGKANPEFQAYLHRCHETPGRRFRSLDHKGAGVQAALAASPELAFVIQGHHGGLPNKSDLRTRIKELPTDATVVAGYEAARVAGVLPRDGPAAGDLAFPPFLLDERGRLIPSKLAFFLRMLFSALVDADHFDTEWHWERARAESRGQTPSLAELAMLLSTDQERFGAPEPDASAVEREVARVRDEVYRACLAKAPEAPGFFRLTVPTGGGKTRSALAFALHHALANQLDRVIVAVPYLTITEQTADVYRAIFKDARAVLEHHSGAGARRFPDPAAEREDAKGGEDVDEVWRRLTTQDWYAPVVVTTTVQLFESLFGRKTSSCRKLHRIARSVVILDEAQTLPTPVLEPILDALCHLVADYGASVVLCTATQPALDDAPGFRGLPTPCELAPDPPRLFHTLKRVCYEWPALDGAWSWSRVAEEMQTSPQALAIVNTRADALALLAATGDNPDLFHLSTLLCGAHRRDTLAVIRGRLREGRRCLVVSTQVVEAGVDLDFPLVLRAMGPLDRIVQAAGRANREGKLAHGRVVVFDPAEAARLPQGPYQTATAVTRSLLDQGKLDLDHPDTFVTYFRRFYTMVRQFDQKDILRLQETLQFQDVAEQFKLIDEDGASVLVCYQGVREDLRGELPKELRVDHAGLTGTLADGFRHARDGRGLGTARALFARAQPYLVTRRKRELERDVAEGNAVELVGGLWEWIGGYDRLKGLTTQRPPEDLIF